MSNYLTITNDDDMRARERAYLHAGRALARFLQGHDVNSIGAFDPTRPSPPTGDPFAAAVAAVVVATSYLVDISVYSRWDNLDSNLSDQVVYVQECGHRGTAFEPDTAGNDLLDDEAWVQLTFETLMLHHWTAVSSVAEKVLVHPDLDVDVIGAMFEVDGPCVWGHYLQDDRGDGHEEHCRLAE